MKKTRKGATLVEIIVSIAVFTIISLAMFSSNIGMRQVVYRQEEYTRFEMICYDINYYWDMYGKDDPSTTDVNEGWDMFYFKGATTVKNDIYTGYFDKDFEPHHLYDQNVSKYSIEYSYSGDELTIVSIKSIDGERVYIENVNCGERVAEVTNNEEQQN